MLRIERPWQENSLTMSMETHHAGGCLCGAVRFEIEGAFDRFFLCHCSRCRNGTGSANASNLFSDPARLTWLSGAEQVRSFTVAGARHSRSFCAICGSALPQQQPTGRLEVPAGSLDSPVSLRPVAHIFCGSRADWDHDLEAVPRHEERPA